MLKIQSWALNGLDSRVAGQLLLKSMYEELTGEEMPPIEKMPRGKPYFLTGDLHFSITHTKKTVFCAISDVPVGIDAEEMTREVNLRLAGKILSPSEKTRFEQWPDPRDALLRLWVLKEAAAKLTGEGLRGFPNQTDFDPADKRIQEIDGCYVAVFEGE